MGPQSRLRGVVGWMVGGLVLALAAASTGSAADAPPRLDVKIFGTSATAAPSAVDIEALLRAPSGTRVAGAPADTVRLLALLVEFPVDTDPATSGDGTFDLGTDDTYSINQPPHDHAYFERQLRAGRNYFAAASEGALEIEYTLFPGASVLEMPNRMRYYNPDTTDAALNRRLAEFLRDAVEAGDAAGAPFSAHDHVMVFHAGVGQDLLIGDTTISDIPSAFLSARELAEFLDEPPTWPGIEVEGGSHTVREGFWLPETENQEGIEFALTGVFAQLMGAQLGLPILFNPDSGAPGVGRFGLMDQGGGNLAGRVPSFPTGWSRFDRGWTNAIVVQAGEDLAVRARGAMQDFGEDVIIVPVDEREYFLIENRKKDLDGNGEVIFEAEMTVPVSIVSNEYDFGIPGSGMLIWHIDQAVIDANRDDNRVNADFRHRGVKLLEADRSDDIGLRENGGFGLPEDAFFDPNNTEITPTSIPSTASNYSDAFTGVHVTAISDSGSVMTCTVSNDLIAPGWPSSIGDSYSTIPPAVGDVTGDGELNLLVVDGTLLRVFDADGSIVREADVGVGGQLPPSAGLVDVTVAPLVGTTPDVLHVIVSDTLGRVRVFDRDLELFAEAIPAGPGNIQIGVSRNVPDDTIVAARGDSLLTWSPANGFFASGSENPLRFVIPNRRGGDPLFGYEFDEAGNSFLGQLDDAPAVRPVLFPVPGFNERLGALIVSDDRTRLSLYVRSVTSFGPSTLVNVFTADGTRFGVPSIGDVDGDGSADIVVGDGPLLRVFNSSGARVEGWPQAIDAFGQDVPDVNVEPLVADLDGDGDQEVILSSPTGVLMAFHGNGVSVDGWPRVAGGPHSGPAIVSDFAGGSIVQVVEGSPWVHVYRVPDLGESHWPAAWANASRASTVSRDLLSNPPTSNTGPVYSEDPNAFYVYPNPARDTARFHYLVRRQADMELTIYDTTGAEVRRFSVSGADGTPLGNAGISHEVTWDLRNQSGESVAPGLYVARLAAFSSGTPADAVRETKVAVVR